MRRKLLVSYIMLVICLLSVSTLAFYSKTQELYMDTLAADMEKQGELLIRILQEESRSESGLQDLVRDYGDLLDCRITIIAGDGRVMADSLEDPQRMENHGDREEVKLALEGKTGSSLREQFKGNSYTIMRFPLPIRERTVPCAFLSRSARSRGWGCNIWQSAL